MEFLSDNNLLGLVIGLSTFLIIGIFHPIVIKGEYYFGTRCWWAFLLLGIGFIALSLIVTQVLWSALLGVTGFSCLWSILEIFEQQERVRKAGFHEIPSANIHSTKII